MNRTLLHQARRLIQKYNLPYAQERAFLTRAFAVAWAQKTTQNPQQLIEQDLNPFLPPPVPAGETLQQDLFSLLAAAPAGEDGAPHAFTPEILALACEQTDSKRRSRGVFYTPGETARILVKETLSAREESLPLQSLTVCDPAAGAGGLIIPLWLELGRLAKTSGDRRTEAFILESLSRQIYAADLDGFALKTLRLRAALTLYAKGGRCSNLFPNLLTENALKGAKTSIWAEKFPDVFRRGGFDLVLANPPYLGQKNNKEAFAPLRQNLRWRPYVTPKGDLLYLFFHLALEILKPQGLAGFLTTAYFTQAASAVTLRARLKQEAAFLRLLEFPKLRLFSDAPGQHNLISVFQKTADKTLLCRIGFNGQTASQEGLYTGETHFLTLRPQNGALTALLQKMASATAKLKDAAHISNGLMTGCDKISAAHLKKHPLPGVQKGAGVFVLSPEEKDALRLSCAEQKKLKPFFKNSDISAYSAQTVPSGWLVDFFYPNDRETDFSQYPRLMAHLARFKPVLLARRQNNNGIDKILRQGIYWFASVRRKLDFDAEKIAVPQRARLNTFAYTPGPWYASSDVYFISRPNPGFSLWYLLALLNSAPYYAWLFYRGKRKGELLELYAQPLGETPIPCATSSQRQELERLTQEIYRQKSKNTSAPTAALEKQVNRLVAGLFGLSQQELAAAQELHNNAQRQ